jgi:hypothetical protein
MFCVTVTFLYCWANTPNEFANLDSSKSTWTGARTDPDLICWKSAWVPQLPAIQSAPTLATEPRVSSLSGFGMAPGKWHTVNSATGFTLKGSKPAAEQAPQEPQGAPARIGRRNRDAGQSDLAPTYAK